MTKNNPERVFFVKFYIRNIITLRRLIYEKKGSVARTDKLRL